MKNNNLIIEKSDQPAHKIYNMTRRFPKDELYGLTSQIRRAAISVPLNVIEGFARQSDKSYKQFLLISYGSLKETKYLLHFAMKEKLLKEKDYKELINTAEEIGKLLWNAIGRISKKN